MEFKEIIGNLITLAQDGEFDVIIQGNNCFNTQGSGLAPQMVKAFGTDKFPMELSGKGDYNKLGQIDFVKVILSFNVQAFNLTPQGIQPQGYGKSVTVVNAYSQYHYGKNDNNPPVDYEALALIFKKINHTFKGKHIGLPLIGCGLAGGDWSIVKPMMQKYLKDMDVTVVHFDDKYLK